jgi:hypothetical protein
VGQPAPDLSARHQSTQHLMGMLTPNRNLDGIALDVSVLVHDTSNMLLDLLDDGPELSDGLRKLWEAKNCLVMQGLIDSHVVGP